MSHGAQYPLLPSIPPQPTWEIAELFPTQGNWCAGEYIGLQTNRLIEFTDGKLEFLPMPTAVHQIIVGFLFRALFEFVEARNLGLALTAPFKLRLSETKFREADLQFMSAAHKHRMRNDCWEGADLVMEVVSESDPDRDLITKRAEYAAAQIPEYWIVDPRDSTITVLTLSNANYVEHGKFTPGQRASSVLLNGFSVDVQSLFDTGRKALASE